MTISIQLGRSCRLFVLFAGLLLIRPSLSYDETGRDTCDNNYQCANGGICAPPNESHPNTYCHCAVGFAGVLCDSYCPLQCQHGGYCRYHPMTEPHRFDNDRNPADYICQCFGLFEGALCEIPYTNCGDGSKCYNGGVCRHTTGNGGVKATFCDCPSGFGGAACESDVGSTASTAVATLDQQLERGFQGNKAALVFGILLVVLVCAGGSWYCITHCLIDEEEEKMRSYEAVEITDTDNESETENISRASKWRNVV
jgi:hypothetical protein